MILDGEFYHSKKGNYDEELQKCIEDTCQYCLANTFAEAEEKINKPIMMLGKIQSGKTRAFTGVIALAFDNDFDIVFILSKNSKALIQQTVSRMKQEFKPFMKNRSLVVSDIMNSGSKISKYELDKKNIIVAKKEKINLDKLIEFIEKYSISENKKCLIIDDEADTTGIGYEKMKGGDDFTLRTVSSKVNEMRGSLDGCVFVEVTATPYALYLQPDFDETVPLHPVKPQKTILVPHGKGYIGGEYYFIDSKEDNHPASLIFEPMSQYECDLVSDEKRKGKKSKMQDRRSFKEEELLTKKEILSTFKKGIVNFILGAIMLREIYSEDECYAYVIHTGMQKNSHLNLESAAEIFLKQIKERNKDTTLIVNELLKESYEDLTKSVTNHGHSVPPYDSLSDLFYQFIDDEYYSIDVVNADKNIGTLLDEESGELLLRTPCSIFVGGQILDRGVTIPNMIGFYYGRNPITMQQDTVLQHSRMFGYRSKLLPVTRFYTTERIYSNMEKITEIDMILRNDIELGKQGEGVYFITNQSQDKQFGTGGIKPCSPSKIRISDVIFLKPHNRVLPVGFSPVVKTEYYKLNRQIEKTLNNTRDFFSIDLTLQEAINLINLVYNTIEKDDDAVRFISREEFIVSLKYMLGNENNMCFVIKKDKNNKKVRRSGRIEDAPDNGQQELSMAKKLAKSKPVVILLQENGEDISWGNRPFWWPILISPESVSKTMYASKIAAETIVV